MPESKGFTDNKELNSLNSLNSRVTEIKKPTEAQWKATGCGTCKYFCFVGLTLWCSHPNHNRQITGPGCKGEDHVDRYQKTLPGHAPSWPQPVSPEERSKPQ